MTRWVVVVAAIALSPCAAAWAQKTDVVTLLNGDKITGEIKNLDRGVLEFSTDDAGTIDIEWDKVGTIEAKRSFEVETSDGRRMLGTLGPPMQRTLSVGTVDGVVALPMVEVTRITPIGRTFWAKLDGTVDAGFTYTHSSGVAQTTFNTTTILRRPAFVYRLYSSATVTKRNDGTGDDDRSALGFSYTHYRGRRLLISGLAALESNESLGLALRSLVAGTVGMRVVNTNRAQLEFGGGLVVNNEQAIDAEATSNLEGVIGLRSSYYRYDRPKTTLEGNLQYFPSLSNWGRQRLQTDGTARREIFKDFHVSLNAYYTFDSDPPNPDAEQMDVGTVLSVGWSF